MKFYNLETEEVLKELKSSEEGLSIEEADERLDKYGENKLLEAKKDSLIKKFISEFRDLMIIVLIISSIISFIISIINNESITDSIIILAIVVLNAFLGFIQELKADKAIDELKKMQVTNVKVMRDNKVTIINSETLVKGDILILEAGDTVPADARIIYDSSLKVDEASLTGESVPVLKTKDILTEDVVLAKRSNMLYMGTNVVYGKAKAVVCETGMNTEFGKIAESLKDTKKETTPLEKKINDISKALSLIIAIIIIVMFLVGIVRGMNFLEILMLSISLAVAAIPEGLPTVITITLSLGMSNLAKSKAIVRKMSSVETLGCTEVICSDKTGTITQNKMMVREVFFNNKLGMVKDFDKNNLLFKVMILNNDALLSENTYIGDSTEIALLSCLENFIDINEVRENNKRYGELPFDSDRKMMSTIHKRNKGLVMYTKGSFDSVINRCKYFYENDKVIPLTNEKKEDLKQREKEESNKAYRVLAYAFKNIKDEDIEINNDLENDLIFIGLTAMIDPPREDVKEAIECCKKASIKPVMITGDSLETAKAIAREVGIIESDEEAIEGYELDKMSEDELRENVHKYSVYARVSPMNKLSIVKAWKDNDKVVAMTGDGVNDAPALKTAHIGVGMGITGTEVSKGVSDIVLADDSFSTIVKAVREGRRIFDNIRNVLVYLLTGNISEVLIVFIGMLFGIEIFLPIQLLYINLITDSIPAIALAFEKEASNIMERKVRKNDGTFFTPFLISKISIASIMKAVIIMVVYLIGIKIDVGVGRTMAFFTLVLLEMVYSYSCRNLKERVMNKGMFSNSYLNKSMLILSIIQLIVFLTPVRSIFNIVSLSLYQILFCILIVVIMFLVDEGLKKVISSKFRDN